MDPQQQSNWHWLHKLAEVAAKVFWIFAILSLLLAWSTVSGGTVFGLALPHWYWNALVFGVLALGAKKAFSCDCEQY